MDPRIMHMFIMCDLLCLGRRGRAAVGEGEKGRGRGGGGQL